jgi:hypothetical protein
MSLFVYILSSVFHEKSCSNSHHQLNHHLVDIENSGLKLNAVALERGRRRNKILLLDRGDIILAGEISRAHVCDPRLADYKPAV